MKMLVTIEVCKISIIVFPFCTTLSPGDNFYNFLIPLFSTKLNHMKLPLLLNISIMWFKVECSFYESKFNSLSVIQIPQYF